MKKNLIILGMILLSLNTYAMKRKIPNTIESEPKKVATSVITVDSINEQRRELSKLTKNLLKFIKTKKTIPTLENVFEPNDLVMGSAKAIAELAKINIPLIENIESITAIMANILDLTETINCDIFSRKPMQELRQIIEEINRGVSIYESNIPIMDTIIHPEIRERELALVKESRDILEKICIAFFPSPLDKKAPIIDIISLIDIISFAERLHKLAPMLDQKIHNIVVPSLSLQQTTQITTIDMISLTDKVRELARFAQIMHDMSNILKLISETALKIQDDLKTLMLTGVRYN